MTSSSCVQLISISFVPFCIFWTKREWSKIETKANGLIELSQEGQRQQNPTRSLTLLHILSGAQPWPLAARL